MMHRVFQRRASAGRRWRRAGAGLLAVALMLPGGGPAVAGKKAEAHGKKERVTLKLRADLQAGFAPLTVTFTGRLRNMDPEDPDFCHAGTFLLRKLVTSEMQIVAGEDPACIHEPDEKDISPTFSYTYTLNSSGSYEFFAMVVTASGRKFTSNGVPIRVLSSPGGP